MTFQQKYVVIYRNTGTSRVVFSEFENLAEARGYARWLINKGVADMAMAVKTSDIFGNFSKVKKITMEGE